jgi:ADP-ribose pyrophosphatase
MTKRPSQVEMVAKEPLYRGYTHLDRYRLRHELYAGGLGPELSREILDRGHAAALMLYDPDADAAVMIEQFRPGAYGAGWEPWLLEVVAGIIEPGEAAEDVCRREAEEEAGVTVSTLFKVQGWLATPGICTETIELWCGRVDSTRAGGIHGLDHEGEDIRVVVLGLDALRGLLDAGALTNATSVIAVQWLLLNRAAVRRRWNVS